ncbi:AlpA family phage regulatory protein [Azohydromonas sp.]|uniref:helix-turn-helix transcriptional regulator n=1 Tax=Azohydromonas sp. TaxID=1872666 RepID=UPI002D1A5679|nr:AlpA family phage regulatory protein [Azohydromonas sp.]HMM85073.1 AlpA family phage regulatory protein [Azohydromonas sp.]
MSGDHKTGEGAAPDRLLRLPAVMDAVGAGRTFVLDRVRNGTFPRPIKIGRATMWSERAVQRWIAEQIASRSAAADREAAR